MSGAAQFTIVITALNKSAAAFRHVNAQVTGMVSPFRNVGRAIADLGEAAGITKLASVTENCITKVGVLGSRLGGLLGPLAAISGIATAGGLFEIAKDSADWGAQLYLSSQKTGMAVDALAKLHYVGQTVEVDAQRMDRALYRLNLTIGKAASGSKKEAAMFRALGIPVRDAHHHLRDAPAIWADLSEAMKVNTSAVIRAQIVSTAFGARFGQDLIPALLKGRKETQALYKTFEQMYGKITPETVRAAYEAEEGWKRLTLSVQGLKFTVGSALFPVLEKIIKPLTQWISANRILISQKVGEWAKRAGAYIMSIDWKKVGETAMKFGHAVAYVGKVLGPVGTTIAVVAVAFSPFIFATLGAVAALTKLAFALGAVILRIGLIAFGGLITSIVTVIPMIRSFRDLWIALDLVMAANPIILTALAIVAVGAAAVYAYNHFKWFHDIVVNTIEYLKRNSGWLKYVAQIGAAVLPGGNLIGQAIASIPANNASRPAPRKGPGPVPQHIPGGIGGVRGFFEKMGWTKTAAAAITGNLAWESRLNPGIRGDNGAAYGLAQWHAARQREFARVMGKPIIGSSLVDQLAFVNHELTKGAYAKVGAALRKAPTLATATAIINQRYESPAAPLASQAGRYALAQSSLSQPVISPRGNAGDGPTHGKVAVSVDVKAPRGTKVATRASGPNPPALDTGLSWM